MTYRVAFIVLFGAAFAVAATHRLRAQQKRGSVSEKTENRVLYILVCRFEIGDVLTQDDHQVRFAPPLRELFQAQDEVVTFRFASPPSNFKICLTHIF